MASSFAAGFVSVFDRTFDVVIYGAGFSGFAAAGQLAARGKTVLLVESSGDLLWEGTRALENTGGSSERHPLLEEWLSSLQSRQGADTFHFEPALAEILAADTLRRLRPQCETLLYATAVAVEFSGSCLAGITVATKSGFRRIQARQWVDATEQASLARLCDPALPLRMPHAVSRSMVLQSTDPESLDVLIRRLAQSHPGLETFRSLRQSERRLRWIRDGFTPWHRKAAALVRDLRALAIEGPAAQWTVSHCAARDFPIYSSENVQLDAGKLPPNLVVLSPARQSGEMNSPADRFVLGANITLPEAAADLSAEKPVSFAPPPAPTLPEEYDVVVAGTGTAGALAAIAAARNGARTLALESSTEPGGIGTGGGISSYFHGAPGGIQSELDLRVCDMSELLTGVRPGPKSWHREAKKFVLLEAFEESGVTFLGDATVCGVEKGTSGQVAAILATIGGEIFRIPAAAFVDCTGDGDLCALAGVPFTQGRVGDGRTLAYSQTAFSLSDHENGLKVRASNYDAGWVDATDPEDLTRARLEGLAQYLRPIWTDPDRPVAMASLLGLRQSRQIQTDVQVTLQDMVEDRRFEDSVGEVETVADTHSVDYEFENDDLAFYFWTCRAFRQPLRSTLPYRMMLPLGLDNVWIACRAAGMEGSAAYGLRMQREMQRLGEAAGSAAALCVRSGNLSREINWQDLQSHLDKSGARGPERPETPSPDIASLLENLDAGKPGIHLWHLYRREERPVDVLLERLGHERPRVSFYAAAILAMWEDAAAEPRLLRALRDNEMGPGPEECRVPGAHGQYIDIPFWLQAVVLLRRAGSSLCLPALRELSRRPGLPLNVRTIIALTLEKLALRMGAEPLLGEALDNLLQGNLPEDGLLPPSRSLWRALQGEEQKSLRNDRGSDTRQDHSWQLHLIASRIRRTLGLPVLPERVRWENDPRGFVRRAFFESLCSH